jgi:hypothetical protein
MKVSQKYGTNKTVRKNYSHDYNHKKNDDKKSVGQIYCNCSFHSMKEVEYKKIPNSKPGLSVDNHFVIDGYRKKIGKIKYCEKCAGRFCCPEPNVFIRERWNKKECINIKYLNDDIDIIEEYDS